MKVSDSAKFLLGCDDILLLTHRRPDGDTLGSAAALCSALRRAGKTAYLYRNSEITPKYLDFVGGYLAPEGYEYKTVVAVDVASEGQFPLGFSGKVDFCVDHHPSNTKYAPKRIVIDTKAACGEIVLQLVKALCGSVTKEEANLLYIAVSTDCGCFQYANTKADTFRAAGELLEAGADNQKLNLIFFRHVSQARLKLEGMILDGLESYRDGKLIVATITSDMIRRSGATENDCDDLSAIAGRVETGLLCVTIREQADGSCRVSLRSGPEINCSDICAVLGGGGHAMAAGCSIDAAPDKAKKILMSVIDEVWK